MIGEYDRVAGRYGLHGGADPLDDARASCPKTIGTGAGIALGHVQVCLQTRWQPRTQNFVRARLFRVSCRASAARRTDVIPPR